MAVRNRSLARRKAKQDRKSQESQKPAAPNAEPAKPEIEVKQWTAAEREAFDRENEVFQTAMKDVNKFLEFLKKQHGIDPKDGWQLGNGCFVREIAASPTPPADPTDETDQTPPAEVALKKVPAKPRSTAKAPAKKTTKTKASSSPESSAPPTDLPATAEPIDYSEADTAPQS